MNLPKAQDLLNDLREHSESMRIEAKAGSAIGPSVMQTVCAFANEPGLDGGFILLGISEIQGQFIVKGVINVDGLLQELENNCRSQFERPVVVKAKVQTVDGKNVVVVYVPELLPASKPCVFKGRFDSHNKRKTGIWRRGPNGDYECSHEQLEPILLARTGMSYEETFFEDSSLEDVDKDLIALYRELRAKKHPQASELSLDDTQLLYALRLIRKNKENRWIPNLACLLVFGTQAALRRYLPMERVDFIRIVGTQWIEDPHRRFSSIDFRESLLTLIPRVEAAVLDTLPKHFSLQEGELQRTDEPLLPQRVVREALVNAVMHRDYRVHSPIQVIRYSDRLEINNAGYSLKPVEELGYGASQLRNPVLASILYDLNFAETKGSGIRTCKQLLREANLAEPKFVSNTVSNFFRSTYSLSQLMSKDDLIWLGQFKKYELNDDEARALLIAKHLGAVNNATLRQDSDLDTLQASHILQKLSKELGLLDRYGAGSATTYMLSARLLFSLNVTVQKTRLTPQDKRNLDKYKKLHSSSETSHLESEASHLESETSHFEPETSHLGSEMADLGANNSILTWTSHIETQKRELVFTTPISWTSFEDIPEEIKAQILSLGYRPKKKDVMEVILRLCLLQPQSSENLMRILRKGRQSTKNYLKELRTEKLLEYVYPQIPNHPIQAYRITEAGKKWLEENS